MRQQNLDIGPDSDSEHLQRRLRALLADARRNEEAWRRFQSLELRIMECSTVADLLQALIIDSRTSFAWERVTLTLVDADFEIERLLEQSGVSRDDFPGLALIPDAGCLRGLYGPSPRPLLGAYDAVVHADLFGHPRPAPQSVALLPLVRNKSPAGSLNLGAESPDRFRRTMATDFLQHTAAVLSVCLDAAIGRERLKHLGLTDALTGVNNRRFFDQRLPEEVSRARRGRAPLSCVFVDIDHFKRINDSLGHQMGDEMLREVARLIRQELRSIDVVARYGGEEFALLLVQAGPDRALEVAERMRRAVEFADLRHIPGAPRISVSAGVATLIDAHAHGEPEAMGLALVERADRALYAAKAAGRNRVMIDRGGNP